MYLVTGGAGFIGSNIVRRMVNMDLKVRVLDDFSTGKMENLAVLKNVDVINGSLLNYELVEQALVGIEYILHHAAIPSVQRSINDPGLINETNVKGTINLLQASIKKKIKKFVFASSSSIYGNSCSRPVDENCAAEPISPYAISKYSGELYVKAFVRYYKIPVITLRYFNVYGPYQDPNSEYAAVIPKFIYNTIQNIPSIIYGDGEQTRDFIFIDDVVEANLLACSSDSSSAGEVFNIARGKAISINELYRLINKFSDSKKEPIYANQQPGELRTSCADVSKAKNRIGFKAKTDCEEGLKKTLTWFRGKYFE